MIKLSDHFTFKRLLQFALPSISTLLFFSIYGVIDGYFVSNYVGKTDFSALNFVMPFLLLLGFVGFLFSSGGSALIAKTLGEGNELRANKIFSLLIYTSIILGILSTIIGYNLLPIVAESLGAEGELLEKSILYGRIVISVLTFDILSIEFFTLFVTAEKPKFGFYITVLSGLTNIIFDVILILIFDLGLTGAAIATALSQVVGGIIPLIYFSSKNSGLLRLVKLHSNDFDIKILIQTCSNGISELMNSISMSIVGTLYNVQLLRFAGEDGVATFGIVMYINFIFQSIFIGFATGTAPIISFHFGAKNHFELRNLLKKSLLLIGIFALIMFSTAEYFADSLANIFASYDKNLYDMTVYAFKIYSFSFLLSGFTIFTSTFFTALNDGITSAIVSFLHLLVFETSSILILPELFGVDGIWFSVIFAEVLSILVSVTLLLLKQPKFKY